MTSLVDVIFLLLLFFMLSSTFSKFAEVEISTGGSGSATQSPSDIAFLRVSGARVTLNGQTIALDGLETRLSDGSTGQRVLVSLDDDVSAQTLTDLLVALRPIPDITVTVLGTL